MRLGWLIAAGVLYFCFLFLTFFGLNSGVRFIELTSLSVLTLHQRTGFPHGNDFYVILSLALLLRMRVNVASSALAATSVYMIVFYFNNTYVFSNIQGGIIYEIPSYLWMYSPLPTAELVYYLALGKFIQFLLLLTVIAMCFRAFYDPQHGFHEIKWKQFFRNSKQPISQWAYQDSKMLIHEPKRERTQ